MLNHQLHDCDSIGSDFLIFIFSHVEGGRDEDIGSSRMIMCITFSIPTERISRSAIGLRQ
jgi:hypothetical protein